VVSVLPIHARPTHCSREESVVSVLVSTRVLFTAHEASVVSVLPIQACPIHCSRGECVVSVLPVYAGEEVASPNQSRM
jgi:hypothetical protein